MENLIRGVSHMAYDFVLAGPLWDQLNQDQQSAISDIFVNFLDEFGVPASDEACQSSALVFAMMASSLLAKMSPEAVERAFKDIDTSLRINTKVATRFLEQEPAATGAELVTH